MSALVPVEPSNALALTSYLEQARDWLARAVHEEDAATIATAKAEIATAAEATKQLNLSKEIQIDAQEMVRRAEFALGKAIRRGQEGGVIGATGHSSGGPRSDYQFADGRTVHVDRGLNETPISPLSLLDSTSERRDVYEMAQADSEEFDAALDAAKAEGNLSRANVVRKIKGEQSHQTRDERATQVDLLASKGATPEQIAAKVGITEVAVRRIIRDYDIYVPAAAVTKGMRRIDHNRVLDNIAEQLDVAVTCLREIDPSKLDQEEALERLDSLTDSIRALSKAVKKIKESIHE